MSEQINNNPLDGKTIKKITWHHDDVHGAIIKISTDDGYDLRYSLGFNGELIYLNTKDSG